MQQQQEPLQVGTVRAAGGGHAVRWAVLSAVKWACRRHTQAALTHQEQWQPHSRHAMSLPTCTVLSASLRHICTHMSAQAHAGTLHVRARCAPVQAALDSLPLLEQQLDALAGVVDSLDEQSRELARSVGVKEGGTLLQGWR